MREDILLSPHFHLSELTFSEKAARLGIRNEPNGAQLENLRRLAQVLEVVRSNLVGNPILVSSGFRNPQTNAAVGGARFSAHLDGRAADFICPGFGSPKAICQQLVTNGVVFDQLIYEGTWVHIGIPVLGERPRQQVLTAIFERGKETTYLKGIC
ncbi:D-Ala-D-Ala carboxypeptidase family metallohydrolase [Variovorax sp. VNK109]|uniref:D-Ala-D-Ala carboxypeptidase family metallohydrolase n=1 Tax=Variovorax sp. VNK109 TaxID=3400919 RepID=UPI003C09D99C